jgi:multimeric flavodoxin WrbA
MVCVMKVTGICGSPIKGNTEWMLDTLLEKIAGSGIETELVLLRKMRIKHCKGCLKCEEGGVNRKGICGIHDDMKELFPKLLEADALVLGTPVYFELVSGLLKNFLDRTNPVWPHLKGKPIAGIAVAEEGIGKTIENLQTYASVCGMPWIGSVTAVAKERRRLAEDTTIMPLLEKLAADMVDTLR